MVIPDCHICNYAGQVNVCTLKKGAGAQLVVSDWLYVRELFKGTKQFRKVGWLVCSVLLERQIASLSVAGLRV